MDGDVLASQLAQLGKQLDEATEELAKLDVIATWKGIEAVRVKEEHEDALARAYRDADGSVETRKAEARLNCLEARKVSHDTSASWELAKADVRNQQAKVRAINARIDIGRSLLSREKSLMAVT
jgi:hypothetical protein